MNHGTKPRKWEETKSRERRKQRKSDEVEHGANLRERNDTRGAEMEQMTRAEANFLLQTFEKRSRD